MSRFVGIDFNTHAIDVVSLDEDTREAEWSTFRLEGDDALDRTRSVQCTLPPVLFEDVVAVAVEEPRGPNRGTLGRVQGAILTRIPRELLVVPFAPSEWRMWVGLSGRASKEEVRAFVQSGKPATHTWPQDACDAYCMALAAEQIVFNRGTRKEAWRK